MIAFGTLSLEEAFKAVDLDAIALLLGMMIIVAQLRVSGFFELANWICHPARAWTACAIDRDRDRHGVFLCLSGQ
jgi:Na+/H+ antiporter NhaD/arsenite permease-like protein